VCAGGAGAAGAQAAEEERSRAMSALFRLAAARARDPAVDAWLDSRAPELGSMARTWFNQMRRCGADVRELIHDGCPVACVRDAAFGYVNVFSAHVNVGFFHGADLDDPLELLEGTGRRMRHVKLRPGIDCDAAALCRLIEDACTHVRRRLGVPAP
jgi:hypothetical protein